MSDDDLIRRGDARRLILSAPATFTKRGEKTGFDAVYSFRKLVEKIAALPADPQIAELQAERARLVEALASLAHECKYFNEWDHCYPGNISLELACANITKAAEKSRALLAELGETK